MFDNNLCSSSLHGSWPYKCCYTLYKQNARFGRGTHTSGGNAQFVRWATHASGVKYATQIAMIQRSASVHPAHGNERVSAGAPPAFRPRVRYELDRSKPRRLPSRVTLAHRRRNWLTSALKAGRLPARVPPAWRQRPLTMENVSALSRESRDSNASLVTAVTAWRVGVC